MITNYVLVDFENVQPANLDLLNRDPFKVVVFVGANQTKVPFDLVQAMQTLGDAGRYVKIAGNGKNALDFHIAYYIGELAAQDPGAYFHVISRDAGFDPLIAHLKLKKIKVMREASLGDIPLLQSQMASSVEDRIVVIVRNLIGRGSARPRKIKTLSNTIHAIFGRSLSEQDLAILVQMLKKKQFIKENNGNVSYQLPKEI